MRLKIDNTKTYAIALEGGGAKGAYEIGAWRALEEAGIKYNAVSGTSVGALNGALMAMRDLKRATDVWEDIRLSSVIDLDENEEEILGKALGGEIELSDLQQLLPQAVEIIRNGGLDVTPLRSWVRQVVDEKRVRESDVELFVATVSLSDKKGLEIKVNNLPDGQICDMLLASAYHPTFRQEKLGGKLYTDGGFIDTLPLHVLIENGYRDIIAIRIPGHGVERHFKMPEDVNVTVIDTDFDLGGTLNFDAEQSRRDMKIGYYDAKRVLYGLVGKKYYIDRNLSDREALNWLLDHNDSGSPLRELCEKELPRLARRLEVENGDYYELMIACIESQAAELGVEPMTIYTEDELLTAIAEHQRNNDGGAHE